MRRKFGFFPNVECSVHSRKYEVLGQDVHILDKDLKILVIRDNSVVDVHH